MQRKGERGKGKRSKALDEKCKKKCKRRKIDDL